MHAAGQLIMVRAARDYFDRTGVKVGFKPRRYPQREAVARLAGVDEGRAGGDACSDRNLFRIGRSGLLTDIERQLWHNVMGTTRRRTIIVP